MLKRGQLRLKRDGGQLYVVLGIMPDGDSVSVMLVNGLEHEMSKRQRIWSKWLCMGDKLLSDGTLDDYFA